MFFKNIFFKKIIFILTIFGLFINQNLLAQLPKEILEEKDEVREFIKFTTTLPEKGLEKWNELNKKSTFFPYRLLVALIIGLPTFVGLVVTHLTGAFLAPNIYDIIGDKKQIYLNNTTTDKIYVRSYYKRNLPSFKAEAADLVIKKEQAWPKELGNKISMETSLKYVSDTINIKIDILQAKQKNTESSVDELKEKYFKDLNLDKTKDELINEIITAQKKIKSKKAIENALKIYNSTKDSIEEIFKNFKKDNGLKIYYPTGKKDVVSVGGEKELKQRYKDSGKEYAREYKEGYRGRWGNVIVEDKIIYHQLTGLKVNSLGRNLIELNPNEVLGYYRPPRKVGWDRRLLISKNKDDLKDTLSKEEYKKLTHAAIGYVDIKENDLLNIEKVDDKYEFKFSSIRQPGTEFRTKTL